MQYAHPSLRGAGKQSGNRFRIFLSVPVIFGVPVKMALLYMKAGYQSEINTGTGGVDSIVKAKTQAGIQFDIRF